MTLEHDGLVPSRPRPVGVDLVERGECPAGAVLLIACMYCPYGHMLECHYPLTCEEAACYHYQMEMELEAASYPPDEEDVL